MLGPDRRALRAATAGAVALTVVHVTIWLMVAAIGGHLDRPWWLWAAVPLGAVLAAAWWLTAPATRTAP